MGCVCWCWCSLSSLALTVAVGCVSTAARDPSGAEAVRTLDEGRGRGNEPDEVNGAGKVDGLVAEERDRMRRGGARTRGTRPLSVGNNGACCWCGTLDGTLVAR